MRGPETLMRAYIDAFHDADMEALLELFADEAVFEFPFAPQGLPRVLSGISEIREYYKDTPKTFRFDRYFDVEVGLLADPSRVVAEYKCDGLILTTERPYRQTSAPFELSMVASHDTGSIGTRWPCSMRSAELSA